MFYAGLSNDLLVSILNSSFSLLHCTLPLIILLPPVLLLLKSLHELPTTYRIKFEIFNSVLKLPGPGSKLYFPIYLPPFSFIKSILHCTSATPCSQIGPHLHLCSIFVHAFFFAKSLTLNQILS